MTWRLFRVGGLVGWWGDVEGFVELDIDDGGDVCPWPIACRLGAVESQHPAAKGDRRAVRKVAHPFNFGFQLSEREGF